MTLVTLLRLLGSGKKAKGAHSERQIPCVYSCILRVYNTYIRLHGVCSLGRYIDVSFSLYQSIDHFINPQKEITVSQEQFT